MDWASLHAKQRGASFWKGFTTGKSQSMGGIPHDTYGMTTSSVHQYVLGIYRKLGLDETKITKFQTGGPDGDLGSNEIKISKDKTLAIVDGSGVLCDPNGIDRTELLRLANERIMVSNFDMSKLSKEGFRVLVTEKSVTLPGIFYFILFFLLCFMCSFFFQKILIFFSFPFLLDGTVIDKCMEFRNLFHLHISSSADLFVPCGGRPEAVNINNVSLLFSSPSIDSVLAGGKAASSSSLVPRFKYIVEGANLFFTQAARLHLESQGVIVFKDASANKGGVTSSSLEVLAALSFSDEDFTKHMCVTDPSNPPSFYTEYVQEVKHTIEENARLEFECIWEENKKTGIANSILSDQLSNTINQMADQMETSGFWEDEAFRKLILSRAFPKVLLKVNGYEKMTDNVPVPYLKAIFHSYLASRFIYKYGASPSQFAFFEFMQELQKK